MVPNVRPYFDTLLKTNCSFNGLQVLWDIKLQKLMKNLYFECLLLDQF
jgi:hypothetical protein